MYPIDELANIVAMASEYEQISLTEDIKCNGQREPAVLWQGKIIDGRCRQLACYTLGIDLLVRELDNKLTRDEVSSIVKSLNTRRNLTDMQKAMSGVLEQERAWRTNEDTAKHWGLPLSTYKNARYIATHRPELVGPLFNGKSVEIVDPDKGYKVTTNKINTLARIVKRTVEKNLVTVDSSELVTFKVDSLIKTEIGKDAFYSIVNTCQVTDMRLLTALIEWANLKFKLEEPA